LLLERFNRITEEISTAEKKSGRPSGSVKLVTVSKNFGEEITSEAITAGSNILGENRVQEAKVKIAKLGRKNIKWHLIGRLQKNKVKYIFDLFDMIHSVDSVELGRAIHKGAEARQMVMPVLVQVNISSEDSKSGVEPARLEFLLKELAQLNGIKIQGLMTIPPSNSDPENSRPHFAQLRKLRDKMSQLNIKNIQLNELSMGMSGDYQIAIEEGATFVRVGSAIFGQRPS
jgi:pyridoxal phosphate enzyme (YggS family)